MLLEPFPVRRHGVDVMVTLEVGDDQGETVCGLYKLEGKISLPPREWCRVVREEMRRIEGEARKAGCNEMRLTGRDWSRILIDYEPFPGLKNGLRKRL